MPQCEMCGVEKPELTTAKIEGAELDVCQDCADFGTEVRSQQESSTSTKYSTGSSSGSAAASGSSAGSGGAGGSRAGGSGSSAGGRRDMFDEMDEVVPDYDERIRRAREGRELTQAELADQLNEKASLIRKLERGESLPSDQVRRKLERALEIDLVGDAGGEDDEWSGGEGPSGVTLGDVVERKD